MVQTLAYKQSVWKKKKKKITCLCCLKQYHIFSIVFKWRQEKSWGSLVIIAYHRYTHTHTKSYVAPSNSPVLLEADVHTSPLCDHLSGVHFYPMTQKLLCEKSNQTPHYLTFEWSKVFWHKIHNCKLPENIAPLICAIIQLAAT